MSLEKVMPPKPSKNNKGREASSGTTSQARRQARESKQWTSLAMADPPATSSASLQEKEDALKQALASVEKQKAAALEKEQEEKEVLKKAEEALEGKTSTGKTGPRSRSQSRAILTPREEAVKNEALKERLAVRLERLKLETGPEARREGSRGPLRKEPKNHAAAFSSYSFKKEASLKKDAKPCVVVDWHNTLEKGNQVPNVSLKALEQLLKVVDVHIISWVGSEMRFEKTMKQIPELLGKTLKKVKSYRCTYASTGEDSKVDWACHFGALCIFDDRSEVIEEADLWGLKAYQIGRGGYWSIADAVAQFMEDLPGLEPWAEEP